MRVVNLMIGSQHFMQKKSNNPKRKWYSTTSLWSKIQKSILIWLIVLPITISLYVFALQVSVPCSSKKKLHQSRKSKTIYRAQRRYTIIRCIFDGIGRIFMYVLCWYLITQQTKSSRSSSNNSIEDNERLILTRFNEVLLSFVDWFFLLLVFSSFFSFLRHRLVFSPI